MVEDQKIERLHEIAGRFCKYEPTSILGSLLPPFDTKKPNLHDSKAEFLEEQRIVDQATEQADGLFEFLTIKFKDDHPQKEISDTLCDYLDRYALSSLEKKPIELPVELVKRNAVDVSVTFSSAHILLAVVFGLKKRQQELKDQEAEFWSSKSRPPNHYARTIALRFARYVAQGTGKKPTVGTSRDGAHPSTDFGRSLEEVFQILDISADFRRAATWAVEQLTDDDLRPPVNAPTKLGSLGSSSNFLRRVPNLTEMGLSSFEKDEKN